MKPEELRIGNWVQYDDQIYKMAVISENGEPCLNTIEYGYGVVEWKDIKPIPLTEDWLLKFGFRDEMYPDNYDIKISDSVELSICTEHEKYSFQIGKYIEWTDNIEIEYVHQLQNLYYSLCGKELKTVN